VGWLRRKQKQVAQQFVDDATETIAESVNNSIQDYMELLLAILPIALPIVSHVISAEKANAPVESNVSTPSTINIYISK
jgi:hypothetical protein